VKQLIDLAQIHRIST